MLVYFCCSRRRSSPRFCLSFGAFESRCLFVFLTPRRYYIPGFVVVACCCLLLASPFLRRVFALLFIWRLPFSCPAGAASVAHACNRCSCHSFCSCSENKLRLSVARTREQQPFITSFWRISRSRAVVLQPRKGLALLEEEAAHRRCPEHSATA